MDWQGYKVEVPEMNVDGVCVKKRVVNEVEATRHLLRCTANNRPYRAIKPGVYTELYIDNELWMSDTPAEIEDLKWLFHKVISYKDLRPNKNVEILLNGLGLGVALHGCMKITKNNATVTVVEKDARIVKHIGSYWKEKYGIKLHLIEGDAFTWKLEKRDRWDIVWHDIWLNINLDNLPEMHKLHRRFGRRCDEQGSWSRAELEMLRKRMG